MKRLLQWGAGILLVPVAAAGTAALAAGLRMSSATTGRVQILSLAAGFGVWLFLYFVAPRPVRSYVFAHEATHALWAALMGGRVTGFRVSRGGGEVRLTRTNLFVVLAPYFFPLYTIAVVAAYYGLRPFFDLTPYELWWLAMTGLTWGFHATFTLGCLGRSQSDVKRYGRLLSYAVIYCMNVLVLGLLLAVSSPPAGRRMAKAFVAGLRPVVRTIISGRPAFDGTGGADV